MAIQKTPPHESQAPADAARLAAYMDGELSLAEAARVEAWLAAHPEGRESLDADRKLQRLWADGAPRDPGSATWDRAFARIENTLASRPKSPWLWRAGGGLAAAAALFLLVWGARDFFTGEPGGDDDDAVTMEVLPVASDSDVVILSMNAEDTGALIVGTPPVEGVLVLAGQDEVKVDSMQSPGDMQPYLHTKGASPMIMVPIPSARIGRD